MALGSKTAGIFSGLGVGVAAGVMLAAINPILPRTDTTQVSDTPRPVAKAPEVEATAGVNAPAPAADRRDEPAAKPAPAPQLAEAVAPDTGVSQPATAAPRPQATGVAVPEGQTQPATPETAMALPGSAPLRDGRAPAPGLSVAGQDDAPAVDTRTADPVRMAEPDASTSSPALSGATARSGLPVAVTRSASETRARISAATQPETGAQAQADLPNIPAHDPVGERVSRLSQGLNAPETTDGPSVTAPSAAPQTPGAVAALDTAPQPETAPQADTQTAPVPTPAQPETVAVATEPEAEPQVQTRPQIVLGQAQARTEGTFRTVGQRLPSIGGTDGDATSAVIRNNRVASRLPTIGGDTPRQGILDDTSTASAPPLARNALPFDDTTRPLLSVVLIDNGQVERQLYELSGLDLPMAIAVAVDDDGARERARRYRNAGFEVLALAPRDVQLSLSGGQTEEQVADLLDRFFAIMPDALGLIDRPAANLQKDRRLARHVVNHLARTGHGVVTYNEGLNSVPRLAEAANVAAGSVFKVLDGQTETEAEIGRALNRAALEARSKGQVIVMATPSPETLSSLLTWTGSPQAREIAVAPVSASMRKPLR